MGTEDASLRAINIPFELRKGDVLLGILEAYDDDWPWIYCDFEPTPAFDEYEPLFTAAVQAADTNDEQKLGEYLRQIEQLGLRLVKSGREAKSLLMRIDNTTKKAAFRGQFHPIKYNREEDG